MTAPAPLTGRAALVTGASGAIGSAIAVTLAEAGAELCLAGRDEARLTSTVDRIAGRAPRIITVVADLTVDGRLAELAAEVERGFAGLDILVHAAGCYARGRVDDASSDTLDELYRTNVRAPYRLTQRLLPMIVDRKGVVVFVNSTQGQAAAGGVGQYAATQHGMRAVADALRAEVNAQGVRVTTLHVGRTASDVQERVFEAEGRHYSPDLLIQPQDIAELVVTAVALPPRAQVTSLTVWPTAKV